eukprot:CAMPEP_0172538056 /NCGR_PEP_ID=MMETSP1067-20121228/9535_1 /TAXON_ID=265564 ORGANISM="Thalassiosira punctigera, Strain Tpunct2005C2" /NCGR_SAMPLE_ID=MMETSP1067 /ASSEMBLY_ACC=CAM_ASM_000444 /LENGTH=165 /DNA_ID=CAMNT_0013323477 /DNA_START=222 /DNA_END=715 /DNA_ORIENTATION=+
MPPKQKMGSITHNSAEVNRGSIKVGMLSKIKGSFTSTSSRTGLNSKGGDKNKSNTNISNKQRKEREMPQSCQHTMGVDTKASRMKHLESNSLIHGDSTINTGLTEELHTTTDRGVPTSITALVDAASVLSDEFDTPQHTGVGSRSYHQDFRPQRVEHRRRSVDYG